MKKEELIELIKKNLSQREISKKLNVSQTNLRYWLNKFELKTNIKKFNECDDKKRCPKCKENKRLDEFYNRRNKEGNSVYCRKCSNEESRERARRFKVKCVEYKGGKCVECGYNKYLGALDFHHLDPSKKDFRLAAVKSHAFNDMIKKELDKCILVCANCHREIHGSLV